VRELSFSPKQRNEHHLVCSLITLKYCSACWQQFSASTVSPLRRRFLRKRNISLIVPQHDPASEHSISGLVGASAAPLPAAHRWVSISTVDGGCDFCCPIAFSFPPPLILRFQQHTSLGNVTLDIEQEKGGDEA